MLSLASTGNITEKFWGSTWKVTGKYRESARNVWVENFRVHSLEKTKKKVNGEFRDNGRKIAESYYKVTGKVPLKDHKMSVKVPGSVCYKQWKVRSGCQKIALGNSRGSSDRGI